MDLNPTIATNYGFVAPRVALTSTLLQAPVVNPQTGVIPVGTVVYNTATAGTPPNNVGPGLYYWNGSRWIAFAGSPGGLDWSLTGNSSTVPNTFAAPGVNYIGTSDNTPIHFSVNGQPRMRITTNGNVGIGQSSVGTTRLIVDAIPTTDSAFRAQSSGNSTTTIIPTASFVNTAANNANSIISATEAVPTGGSANIAIRAGSGRHEFTVATDPQSYIAPTGSSNIGITSNATNLSFYGITEGTSDTNRRAAEFRTNNAGSSVDADANDPVAYLAGYASAADLNGTAGGGSKGLKYGGYFYSGPDAYSYVGATITSGGVFGPMGGSTLFKIVGPGTVSTIVSSDKENDTKKIMFAPEAPEVLFEDYGTGQLTNGSAKIDIDPIFAKNIFVDEKHPLKVFIQLEGDCNGVFVTNKSKNGFTVKELNRGKSNVKFSWHIVGNRADETRSNGEKITY